jgi:hypothetical protein
MKTLIVHLLHITEILDKYIEKMADAELRHK